MSRERIDTALINLGKSRRVLKGLLEDIQPDEWFRQPEGVTNLAWQVGHLAAAKYALCLGRARGQRDEDEALIPQQSRTRYGRGSTPSPDPQQNDSPEELLAMLERVDAQAEKELTAMSDDDLADDIQPPHPMFKTKLEAVEFCPLHEMMHVGQVILLRRLMGRQPRF